MSTSMNLRMIRVAATLLAVASAMITQAQQDGPFREEIALAGRQYKDSVQLRWAPLKSSVWQLANKNGYRLERFTLAREGKVLQQPERVELTAGPLKPLPEEQWQFAANQSKYHAIAAQALFGDRFEVDLSKSDMFTIVNKVKENEQRFSFALFSADMSVSVAKASALWFTDKTVKSGEKYLYRISIASQETMRGSLFINPDDVYELIKPQNIRAEFKGPQVTLRWDKDKSHRYTAYILERSIDGQTFRPISDAPLVTVSPTDNKDAEFNYAVDSLTNVNETYYYRVKGVTPFGDAGPVSDVSKGKSSVPVADVPYIHEATTVNNTSVVISWQFAEKNNASIRGFSVERTSRPGQGAVYKSLTLQSPLPATARSFEDKSPAPVNYYRVFALGQDGEKHYSPDFLVHLVDSVPPAVPTALKAKIDADGIVQLSWDKNKDPDIFGYRIYRSNLIEAEFSQITSEPVRESVFTDRVNVNTLSKEIYYKVMAIDRSQNHSDVSQALKVMLPDKVRPQPPVFLPVKSEPEGTMLTWMQSSSDDVKQYEIFRKASDRPEWQRIKIITATADSVYAYQDTQPTQSRTHAYTVVAVDHGGLESEPSLPVSANRIDTRLKPAVTWKEPQIIVDQKKVVLRWDYAAAGVQSFKIYKATGDAAMTLYKSIAAEGREFTDSYIADTKYTYRIMAVFTNGTKSNFSSALSPF